MSPELSRAMALAAARKLLLERGPQAVTLKAVAAEIGRTHANLLHHFGSAAGLQAALARSTADRLNASIAEAVERAQSGEADAREIVDRTFDAFGNEGAGISPELRVAAKPIAIRMSSRVESLNVAASAAIQLARSFALR